MSAPATEPALATGQPSATASTHAPAAVAAGTAHPSVPTPVVTLLGLAAAVIVLGGMRSASGILGPTVLAFVVAIAVYPLQAWLSRWLPRWLAMTATLLFTYAAISAFVWALVVSVLQFANQVPQYQAELEQLVAQGQTRLEERGVGSGQIDEIVSQVDVNSALTVAVDLAQQVVGVFSDLLFVLALLLFVLVDANAVKEKLAAVAELRPDVARAVTGFAGGVRRYLVVTTIFGAIVAAFDVGLLVVIGVPLPLLWGLLAFLTGYIPTIGLVIGIVPPAVIALLDGGLVDAAYVVVGYLLINNIIQTVIQPKFVGDAVGLSITMSFLSLIVWSFVLGPLGALLAIPLSLLTRAVLSDVDPRHRWVGFLVSDRPPPPEEVDRLARQVRTADLTGTATSSAGTSPPSSSAASSPAPADPARDSRRGRSRGSARTRG